MLVATLARSCRTLAVLVLLAGAAEAQCLPFGGSFNGAQVVPPSGSPATGQGIYTFSLNTSSLSLNYTLSFTGLASQPTQVHLHQGAPGVSGVQITSLVVGNPSQGSVVVPSAYVPAFLAGSTYIDVHNATFPNGEIRGQVNMPPAVGTTFCDPGSGPSDTCPCINPATGPGTGCDNSSATGGAKLTARGVAQLSFDFLEFFTQGEKPSATSIVLQGDALTTSPVVFGQGERCVGGGLLRLYTKTAVSGAIVAPSCSDPRVAAQSLALGDTIQPNSTRYYQVYYRDPIVLGGCPATSTFNATQAVSILWTP